MCAVYTYEIRPVLLFFFPPAFSRALISHASRSAAPSPPGPRHTSRNIYSLPASRSIPRSLATHWKRSKPSSVERNPPVRKMFRFRERTAHARYLPGSRGISLRRNALLWASCKRLSANEESKKKKWKKNKRFPVGHERTADDDRVVTVRTALVNRTPVKRRAQKQGNLLWFS